MVRNRKAAEAEAEAEDEEAEEERNKKQKQPKANTVGGKRLRVGKRERASSNKREEIFCYAL